MTLNISLVIFFLEEDSLRMIANMNTLTEAIAMSVADTSESLSYSAEHDTYVTTEAMAPRGNASDTAYTYNRLSLARLLLAQPHTIAGFILSVIAIVLNIATLFALSFAPGRTRAYLQLIRSLACSDILIAVTCVVHNINRAFNPVLGLFTGSEYERLVVLHAYNHQSTICYRFIYHSSEFVLNGYWSLCSYYKTVTPWPFIV